MMRPATRDLDSVGNHVDEQRSAELHSLGTSWQHDDDRPRHDTGCRAGQHRARSDTSFCSGLTLQGDEEAPLQERRRNSSPNPSMRFSNSGSTASGVTSRGARPVPPVIAITSASLSVAAERTSSRIRSRSSRTGAWRRTAKPASVSLRSSNGPDSSSAFLRESLTVTTSTRMDVAIART